MGIPIAVGLGLAWRWVLLYGVLSLVTQIWAGSEFSPGQGGGLAELLRWSVIFGVVAIAAAVERAINSSRIIEPRTTFRAALVGTFLGGIGAIVWFSMKGGPSSGDWWVAPAVAAAAVILWVFVLAPQIPIGDSDDDEGAQL